MKTLFPDLDTPTAKEISAATAGLTGLDGAYDVKAADYFELARPEMLPFFPRNARRVLDVGCGGGVFGATLKAHFGCEVWGVEANRGACAKAAARLDRALHGLFDHGLKLPVAHFDCIFFNDVLEHMVDPHHALMVAKKLLAPSGKIVASIPNITFFPTLWRLVIRGQWEYADQGTLDRTHLRFFTRLSIHQLFTDTGFAVEKLDGINDRLRMQPGDHRLWKYYRLLSLLPSRRIREMRFLQFAVVAGCRQSA